jgi:hypothetical protein
MADDSTIASSSRPTTPTAANLKSPTVNTPATRQPVYRFAWDLPSRRVGPGSVADTVDSRADFVTPHAGGNGTFGTGSNFRSLSFSSLSLQATAIPSEWSASKYGLNGTCTDIC